MTTAARVQAGLDTVTNMAANAGDVANQINLFTIIVALATKISMAVAKL